MSVLTRAKKIRISDTDWQMIQINPYHEKILQTLGLIP